MPGLVPPCAGHPRSFWRQDVDGRDKPGHDKLVDFVGTVLEHASPTNLHGYAGVRRADAA
ncbi:MAG: hypothetical protein E6G79_24475 [Alphaproteobacteria bacterium]|nr:MAG: hypothetical protein E6G79_24475 [Alphaproteobacteria bacterium]